QPSFTPGFVDNFGRINLAGGKLLGSGSVSNNAGGASGGGVIAGGGTVQLNIIQNGGTLRADDTARPLIITSPIVIADPASQIVVAANSVLNLQQPLSNSAI